MQTNMFYPQKFFDLKNIFFAKIFAKNRPVWEALKKIPQFLSDFSKNRKPKILKFNQVKIEGFIFIDEGTIIDPFVYIRGPCYIGKNCHIGTGVLLRENTIIADNCTIGHASEIKNSIFLPNSTAAHFNYIGDSIIGRNVNVASSTILANLRLDHKTVTVKVGKEKVETGLKKFGAIIGDNSQIAVSCVLNPGTVLGKSCIIYPKAQLSGYYKEESLIK